MNEEGQIGEGTPEEDTPQEGGSQQPREGQPPQQRVQQQPPQPSHQRQPPRRQQTFSPERLNKTLGMALVIGVILLFIGAILVSSSGFIETKDQDDWNLKRNLNAVATLLSSIGLLAIGGAAAWAFYQADQLAEKQKMFLILLVVGTIVGFAILLASGPVGIGGI